MSNISKKKKKTSLIYKKKSKRIYQDKKCVPLKIYPLKENLSNIQNRINLNNFIVKNIANILKIKLHNLSECNLNKKFQLKNPGQVCSIFKYFKNNADIKFLSSELGSYGFPFKFCFKNCSMDNIDSFALKILTLEKDDQEIEYYQDNYSPKNSMFFFSNLNDSDEKILEKVPQLSINVEIIIIYLLSSLVKNFETPHINLPILAYSCKINHLLPDREIKNLELEDNIPKVNILMSEWCNQGTLRTFIKSLNKDQRIKYFPTITFQIIYTLMVIQNTYPNYRHNDLSDNNILVYKLNNPKNYLYQIEKNSDCYFYLLENCPFQLRLWDFDFSCIKGVVDNFKVLNFDLQQGITDKPNKYYDLGTIFSWIYSHFKNLSENITLFFDDILNYIDFKDPNQFDKEYNRPLIQKEFTTPKKIIEKSFKDPKHLFYSLLINEKDIYLKKIEEKYLIKI